MSDIVNEATIRVVADASGVETGLRPAVEAAQRAGQAIAQSGASAAGAAKAVDAAQRNIVAAIQRTTLAMEAGGRTTAAFYEQMGAYKGVDPASLAPYIAQLRAVEAAQVQAAESARNQAAAERELAQAQATKDSFLAGLREQIALFGKSTDEVLRYRAAQAGAGQEAAHLILQLQNMRAAHDQVAQAARAEAQAQREAAQAQASREAFISNLNNQVNAIGKTRSQLLEMQAAQLGLSEQAAPLIQRLRETEAAFGDTGKSAAETANAMRMVPAQVTDIITSLQGGVDPFTVLIQQGGQLRDSFGGIGPAARAVGSEVLKLVNPYTAAAAAAAALAVAYYQGSKEADGYRRSIVLTGNAAGTSANQLADLAREVGGVVGTQGKASQALAALAGSGQVAAKNMKEFGVLAVQMEREVGQSIEATVSDLSELGKSPVEASLKLNEAYRYLTAATLEQIKALDEQGKSEEAGELAQKAYTAAFSERTAQMRENLGLIEGAWRGAADTAKAAWDAFLDVGRKQTPQERLEEVRAALANADAAPSPLAFGDRSGFSGLTRQALNRSDKAALQREEVELVYTINKQAWDAAQQSISQQFEKAMIDWNNAGEAYLSKAQKLQNAENKIREAGEKAGVSEQEIISRIAQAKAESVNQGIQDAIAGLRLLDGVADQMLQRELARIATRKSLGEIGEDDALRAAAAKEMARLSQREKNAERELALARNLTDGRNAVARAQADLENIRAEKLTRAAQLENDLAVAQSKRFQTSEENHLRGIQSAEAELKALKEQVDAQVTSNAEIGLSKKEVADLAAQRLFAAAAQKEQSAAAIEALDPESKLIELYRQQAAELRSLAGAKRTGGLKADAAEVSKKALDDLTKFLDPSRAQTFGEALREAFGRAGESLSKLTATLDGYGKRQAEIAKHRETAEKNRGKGDFDEIKYLQTVAELNKRQTQDQLASYGSMASAAAGFFGEQSKGYEALMAVSKVFHAAELAMTLAELVPKGISAVLNQGNGDPYTAFGRMAAMAALVAGLGVAIGGVSGSGPSLSESRQKAQGTGSVFGDSSAKSESIAKSLNMIEKATFQDLNVSTGMLDALRNIEASIGQFASLLVRSTGVTGDFGAGFEKNPWDSKTVDALGTGAGAIAGAAAGAYVGMGTSYIGMLLGGPLGMALGAVLGGLIGKTFVGKALGSIFGGRQTVEDTGLTVKPIAFRDVFQGGVDAAQYADIKKHGGWFSSDKTSVKLEGLGLEGNRQIATVLTSLYDSVFEAGSMLGLGADDFSQRLNSFVVDIGKISFKGMKADEIQKTLSDVFSKVGDDLAKFGVSGLEQFQKVGEGYLETLARVATGYQTVTVVTDSLGMAFNAVGLGSIEARERLIELAGGLEGFTSGAEKFLSDFYTEQEQADALRKRISPTLDQFGIKTGQEDSLKQFRNVVTGLDLTTEAGAKAYATLMQIAPAFRQIAEVDASIFEERRSLQDQLDELTMSSTQLLAKQRDALHESNRALFDQVQAIKSAQKAAEEAASLLGGVDTAFSTLQGVVNRQKALLQEEIGIRSEAVSKLQGLANALRSSLSNLRTPEQQEAARRSSMAEISAALAIARASGKLPDVEKLQRALADVGRGPSIDGYATYQDYQRDLFMTQGDLKALADLSDVALSTEEKSLRALEEQVKQYDRMLEREQEQIDVLKGIGKTGLSIEQALKALHNAISAASANPIVAATPAINQAYQTHLGRPADAEGLQWWQNAAAGGTPVSQIVNGIAGSTEASLVKLYRSVLGREPDKEGLAFWAKAYGPTMSEEEKADWLKAAQAEANKKLRGFAIGTNRVLYDTPAMIHKDERIMPAADNRELMRRLASPVSNSEALSQEVARLAAALEAQHRENALLRQSLEDGLLAIATHTSSTASTLDDVVNGRKPLPTEVVTTPA